MKGSWIPQLISLNFLEIYREFLKMAQINIRL